ncbi:MAG: hypothetical protein JJ992_04465 [Planctomycetes bacterium]|nr:hypothetical protein [Planctomycetota bacterium]
MHSLASRRLSRRQRRHFALAVNAASGAWALVAVALLPLVLAGCSPWSVASVEQTLLKPPRMSPDTVVLEMVFLNITDHNEIWTEVDEQHLPVELRRELAEAGFRAGVIGIQLPSWIGDRLEQQKKTVQIDEETGSAIVGDQDGPRRLQCRSDQPRDIPIGPVRKQLKLNGDDRDATDESLLEDAQCRLSVVSQAQGDGRVRLRITPEIGHGPARHRWVGSDGSFRVDLARDCRRYDELTITAVLSPGQTLILGPGPESEGLGRIFFGEGEGASQGPRVLLLRVAQTQFDDLFSPPPTLTPIATEAP